MEQTNKRNSKGPICGKKKYGLKTRLINISLSVVVSLICLGVAEIVVRMTAPQYLDFQSVMDYSELTVRALKPNIRNKLIHPANGEPAFRLTTNSLGLRSGMEISFNNPENAPRILALGDSYTFGFGVEAEEAYPAILENLLNSNQHNGRNFQVINAGFASGSSTDSQYLYLREIGYKFSPSVVTLGFCIVNDLVDIERNRWVYDNNGGISRIINPNDRLIPAFVRKSALLAAIKAHLFPPKVEEKNDESLNTDTMKKLEFLLKEFKHIGKEKKFTFLLVIIPPLEIVLDINYKGKWNQIREKVIMFCVKNDILYVDLTTGLEKKSFFERKVHFSKEGNKRVAEIIYNKLAQSVL